MNELQLLSGDIIDIGYCKVYPLTLREIKNIGEQIYNSYLISLLFSKSDINKEMINSDMWDEFLKMDEYEFLLTFILQNENFQKTILSSLSLFLREKVYFHSEIGLFIPREDEPLVITKDIFKNIKDIVMQQNFIKTGKAKEEEFNPYNDKARELIEKRNKFRKMIQEQNAQEGLNLGDIISIVAVHSYTYDFYNIWDLTVYHLYTIYLRMAMKDKYETYIYFLPHSSENKIEQKHWMSKINKNN